MLIKLNVDDINKHWEMIAPMIEESLPPIANGHIDRMANLLKEILKGSYTVWLLVKPENRLFSGVLVTTVTEDKGSGTRELLIYALFGGSNITRDVVKSGFNTLKAEARNLGCDWLSAYTQVASVKTLWNSIGGDTSWNYLKMDLDTNVNPNDSEV